MNVILPIAGKSSRFPDLRPKWMLTNPTGNLMLVDSILGMELNHIDSLNIIYLKEHEEKFSFKQGVSENLKKYNLDSTLNFIELPDMTKNQVETVRYGLCEMEDDISFIIKDSDNKFNLNLSDSEFDVNFVSYCKIENLPGSDIISKSYLEIDELNVITNIVEKKIISNKFCCGAYYFTSSFDFLSYSNINSTNLFISDVVFNMMLHGKTFIGRECTEYKDWGTLAEWEKYKRSYITLFVDIDGVLFENSSLYVYPYIGDTSPLMENINVINELSSTGRVEVILTTSRPEETRKKTEDQLKSVGLKYKYLLMGLFHAKRILINDFSKSNPYKSCDSINIERDTKTLRMYLNGVV